MSTLKSAAAPSPQSNATADYLKSIGIDPAEALGAPPELDAIRPELSSAPRFVGALNPDMDYYRANRSNPREVAELLRSGGYVVADQTIRLEGCSTPDDLILMRRKSVSEGIEQREKAERNRRRAGGRVVEGLGPNQTGTTRVRDERQVQVQFPTDLIPPS